jgi:cytoskeletal protein RodZ
MSKHLLAGVAIAGMLAFGIPTVTSAAQQTTAQQDAAKAKKEAEKAAKEAGSATKDAAKATAKGTKHAAKVVKKKLTPNTTSAPCKDGTTQTGKTKTTACHDHGGVQS